MSRKGDHEVPRSTLERFASGDASEAEREQVLRHLMAGCRTCRAALRLAGWHSRRREMAATLGNVVPAGPPAATYDDAFAAARQLTLGILDREHIPVRHLLAEVEAMAPEERELRVRNAERYAVGELALALSDRSFELRHRDPEAMLHYAVLAVAAAEAATPETSGGRSLLCDCRALTWAQLGNAHRIRSQQFEAERCFNTALRHLEEGSGDAEPRARVLRLLASLRIAQRAFGEAIGLLEEAGALYRRLKDRVGEAAILLKTAAARIFAADPEPAIPLLLRCLDLALDCDPDLWRAAAGDLVACYVDVGSLRDAYNLVAMAEEHFEECPDELLRLYWTAQKGKVDRERGDLFASEWRLRRVRDGFERAGLPQQVGEASLELAMVHARQGRRADFLRAVSEAAAIFQSLGARREFLVALGQLSAMTQQGEAAVKLLRQLAIQCRGGVPRAES